MSEKDRPDFASHLYLKDIVAPEGNATPEAQIKIYLAKIIESSVSKICQDQELLDRVKRNLENITSSPQNPDDTIRVIVQSQIISTVKQTTDSLSALPRGLQMNEIIQLAIPIVTAMTMQALRGGMIIKGLADAISELKGEVLRYAPLKKFDAKYLMENLGNFIKNANENRLSFSMVAVRLQETSSPKTGNLEDDRLISFMEMVLRRKNIHGEQIELIAMEQGYFILLFINSTTKTACVCAWEIDEEIKKSFENEYSVAVASYDPKVFDKAISSHIGAIQSMPHLPVLYGLTFMKMLDLSLEIARTLPKYRPGIIVQCKKILNSQAFERDGTEYILDQSSENFQGLLRSNLPKSKPYQVDASTIEPKITNPTERPSSIRKVYYAEEQITTPQTETGPLTIRREVMLKGLRAVDPDKNE